VNRLAANTIAGLVAVSFACALAGAARADESVVVCGPYANNVFTPSSQSGITVSAQCPGSGLYLGALGPSYSKGQAASWQAVAPPGFAIVGAGVPAGSLFSDYVNAGNQGQYGGNFYWAGGSSNIVPGETGVSLGPFSSNYLGFVLVCGKSPCTDAVGGGTITVAQIDLTARETTGPGLSSPNGLWQSNGWVRGSWPLNFWGNSPSGLCGLVASFDGGQLPGTTAVRNPSIWHQCAAGPVADTVVTEAYGQGAQPLNIAAWDAAGETVSDTKTIWVDNSQPTVTLSGPADAASTAGTQYVTAVATAGPSGVAGIACSLDNGHNVWSAGSVARVPVSGVGQHTVNCLAENNAVDGSGVHGYSAPESFSMKIGVPTVAAIGFSKIVNRLRCHRTRGVTRCHERTALRHRTIWVTVRRHGRRVRVKRHETVRVVVLPHVLHQARRRVGHGRATTISGWLGTYRGLALGGQQVRILAAADDGRDRFGQVTTATTAPNGSWSAKLPPGPSRLVEARYGGGVGVQPSVSGLVHEIVPAKVELLSVAPHAVAWGGTIRLVGQLKGGHLPAGGALVRLRIGLGSSFTTYGVHEHVERKGRFSTSYTFGVGDPSVHRSFWFQIASLPMGDYPYAPASSRRVAVLVGGHP
jgi:hypothetical protein